MKMNNKINNNTLPTLLHQVMVGIMLSDGGIFYASVRSATPRFEFSMGQDRWAFAQHLASLFKEYAVNPLKAIRVQAIVNGKWITSYRFKTKSLSIFTYYRNMFYKYHESTGRYVKVVPAGIIELLTPVALAYLIMGDGNYDSVRNRVRIYTNSFTKKDVERLAEAINKNFGIYAGVMLDRKDQYIITIGAKELDKLRSLVLPHMVPSMKYRVGVSNDIHPLDALYY